MFYTQKEATILIEQWRCHDNVTRPHSSLGYRPPAPETIIPACTNIAGGTIIGGRPKRCVDVWSDGVYFSPRFEHERQCILVVIGADASGKKELLAIDDGFHESEQSWHESEQSWRERAFSVVRLRDENGLTIDPELATGYGALGFWKAARKIRPSTRQQRLRPCPGCC